MHCSGSSDILAVVWLANMVLIYDFQTVEEPQQLIY